MTETKVNILAKDENFKMLFGSYENIEIVTSFLSSYLHIPYEDLKGNIEFLKQEVDEQVGQVHQRVDVLVKLPKNHFIQIEMNARYSPWTRNRNFIYAIKNYVSQFKTAKDYNKKITYLQINFNNYGSSLEKPVLEYGLRSKEGKVFIDGFEIHEINVPYCKKLWYDGNRESEVLWGSIFHSEEEELETIVGDGLMNEEAENKFKKCVTVIKKGDPMWWDYEEDNLMIENAIKSSAREEGLKEGREEGLQQGIQQGIQQGVEQGIKETARKMKKEHMDIHLISKITNLTEDEIESL